MKNYLILLLSFLLLSCSDKEDSKSDISNATKNTPTILKIANDSSSDISIIYRDYNEGVLAAKKENKSLFILFSTTYCRWCIKLKETTLKDPEIIKRVNEEFIVVFLDRDNDSYPKNFQVKGVPSLYLTSKNEEIFTKIIGYHKNPKDYLKWFNYIKIELARSKEESTL